MKRIDITGQVFNRLTAISFQYTDKRWWTYWLFSCSCGKQKIIRAANVKNGKVRSCGCYQTEIKSKIHSKHRFTVSPTPQQASVYRAWQAMKNRCRYKNGQFYEYYGGRGIKVCERWANSFENFLADMGMKPSSKHSLDRFPNKDGNYEPKNCRWATLTEQANNTSRNVLITISGKTDTFPNWCRKFGKSYRPTYNKIFRQGVPPSEAFSK